MYNNHNSPPQHHHNNTRIGVKQKYFLIVTAILIVGLITILLFVLNGKPTEDRLQLDPAMKRVNIDNIFLINKVDTFSNVLDYSWKGDLLVYATNQGIYEAEKIPLLTNLNITYISFNNNGQAIFRSNDSWKLFEYPNNVTDLNISAKFAYLSKFGNDVYYFTDNILFIKNTNNNTVREREFESDIITIKIADNGSNTAVLRKDDENSILETLNKDLNTIYEASLENESSLFDLSPSGEKIAIILKQELIIKDVKNKTKDVTIPSTANIAGGGWIDEKRLIIYQQSEPDRLGRVIHDIWKYKTNRGSVFLTDDKPIPGKVDPKINTKLNISGNTAAFIEKGGQIWIISLTPNKLPHYTNLGVLFTEPPIDEHPDHHH